MRNANKGGALIICIHCTGVELEGKLESERRRWERQQMKLEEEKEYALAGLTAAEEKMQLSAAQRSKLEQTVKELEGSLGV